jgi:pilus assembly protein Flp/PilA
MVTRTRARAERGASAVEYGLLIAGIAALIVIVVFAFGDNINDIFNSTCDAVNGSAEAGCSDDGSAPAGSN